MTIILDRPEVGVRWSTDMPAVMPGDHLDRATFRAFNEAMPAGIKAELVGGVVYIMPALYVPHAEAHAELVTWLAGYKAATPGLRVFDNVTVALLDDGEPQPDACMILPESRGGKTRVPDQKYLEGAPELVAEVAFSSAAYDLYSKKADYERAGVREYVVVVLQESYVVWFALRNGRYEALAPGNDGLLRSEFFPGLWLDPASMLRRDANAVHRALELGLATPEHAEFARSLAG